MACDFRVVYRQPSKRVSFPPVSNSALPKRSSSLDNANTSTPPLRGGGWGGWRAAFTFPLENLTNATLEFLKTAPTPRSSSLFLLTSLHVQTSVSHSLAPLPSRQEVIYMDHIPPPPSTITCSTVGVCTFHPWLWAFTQPWAPDARGHLIVIFTPRAPSRRSGSEQTLRKASMSNLKAAADCSGLTHSETPIGEFQW